MTEEFEERPVPVMRGDWVQSRFESIPRVGRVRDGGWTGRGDSAAFVVDVVLYDYDGKVIGRESPAMGGPKSYETQLDYADWFRIEKPKFPLAGLSWVDEERDGQLVRVARHLTGCRSKSDRTGPPKRAARAAVTPSQARTDFDPELEIRTRRMAAQELRDIYRTTQVTELADRAGSLEAEADAIAREHHLVR